MRTFLAVVPPIQTAETIHDAYQPMRDAWDGVRWVPPRQYHVTLAFLGEHPDDAVNDAAMDFGRVLTGFGTFRLGFSGEGRFGSASSPRVLLLKAGPGREQLQRMLDALRPVLERYSMWEDRPYRPHLSLGRPRRRGVRGPEGGALLPPGMKSPSIGSFPVDDVVLYRSVLSDKGPEYSVLQSWSLKEDSR